MTMTSDPVATARGNVAILYTMELQLADRRMLLAARLPELEALAGKRALEALASTGRPAGAADEIVAMEVEVRTLDAAITEARSQRLDAIRSVFQFEMVTIWDQADALIAEADELEPKVALHLEALAKLQECEYQPALVPPQPDGSLPRMQVLPKTALLRLRADDLRSQAHELERRKPAMAGTLTASSSPVLLEQLRAFDPMVMAPTLVDVAAWAEAAERLVRARLDEAGDPLHELHGAVVALTLSWRAGRIAEGESSARLVPRAPAAPIWAGVRAVPHGEKDRGPLTPVLRLGFDRAEPVEEPFTVGTPR